MQTIVVHGESVGAFEFSDEQKAMIRDSCAPGATDAEFRVMLEIARLRRLNPLTKQIHFVKRWNKDLGHHVWTAQVSIDGLRAIAERTGRYDGQDEPEFGPVVHGAPEFARVRIYRKDWSRPAVGVAYWAEYVQRGRDNSPTRFWRDMPRVMIAKCAEAIGMRKAFPEDMSGLYVDEEMAQTENRSDDISPHQFGERGADDGTREWSELMATLGEFDRRAFDPGCSWETMTEIRAVLGRKGAATPLSTQLSELYRSDRISPAQRKNLAALWNRLDRKLTQLETRLPAPSVEDSFRDQPDESELDAFSPNKSANNEEN